MCVGPAGLGRGAAWPREQRHERLGPDAQAGAPPQRALSAVAVPRGGGETPLRDEEDRAYVRSTRASWGPVVGPGWTWGGPLGVWRDPGGI
ncbi:hypothetical protein NDU88_002649 [Pleurodeles waltl]|uniref:Uncharacterized protein n=1 Tax=Pleurodeles waltl TaxID=8319 RepID=A0AAV7SCM7_PLEWA|nr:hypothetical protein NDU88_002649 [Pleurodeles waltl]